MPAQSMAAEEVSRQVIDWHAGSGVGAVRIVLSRRQGDQWLAHTTLTQALDDDNRVEVIFSGGRHGIEPPLKLSFWAGTLPARQCFDRCDCISRAPRRSFTNR